MANNISTLATNKYNQGVTAADNRAEPNSINYQTGYNNGINILKEIIIFSSYDVYTVRGGSNIYFYRSDGTVIANKAMGQYAETISGNKMSIYLPGWSVSGGTVTITASVSGKFVYDGSVLNASAGATIGSFVWVTQDGFATHYAYWIS
jgi:hypothetical protein